MSRALVLIAFAVCLPLAWADESPAEPLGSIPLKSAITCVQPMTGIVFWHDSPHNRTDAIQLEFSYMPYGDVVVCKGEYDWKAVDRRLAAIAARGHQAILRFYFVYPGKPTTVPAYIKALGDYHETQGISEGEKTSFPDWSHAELKRFTKEFYSRFAERYDHDPRLAFVQTGFGLWAEYHIYDGPFRLGGTFPDKAFQAEFLRHMSEVFKATPWSISVDAADETYSPIVASRPLWDLKFGLFDDSLLAKEHPRVNEKNWNAMGRQRWKHAPAGGELSYYTPHDQKAALSPNGPHGVRFETAASTFHLSYVIGNDQPLYQTMERIKSAGMALGYRFRVTEFKAGPRRSTVTITNTGIAPLYHDAFPAVNKVRATASLKGLLPGESRSFSIESGGDRPQLTIESDRLSPGQIIEYEADLSATIVAQPSSAVANLLFRLAGEDTCSTDRPGKSVTRPASEPCGY